MASYGGGGGGGYHAKLQNVYHFHGISALFLITSFNDNTIVFSMGGGG